MRLSCLVRIPPILTTFTNQRHLNYAQVSRFSTDNNSLRLAFTRQSLKNLGLGSLTQNKMAQFHTDGDSEKVDAINASPKTTEIEIEQKFSLSNAEEMSAVEQRLKILGFEQTSTQIFKDTYFDLPAPHWCLTPNDKWLRYRELFDANNETVVRSSWQFKFRPESMKNTQTAATVYGELEGSEALDAALMAVAQEISDDNRVEIPLQSFTGLPENSGLVPFAAFRTYRSHWVDTKTINKRKDEDQKSTFDYDVSVDLDGTDFGYLVGEVEIVVRDESEIDMAKEIIEKVIVKLSKEEMSGATNIDEKAKAGKLSAYMMEHCREQYNLCVTKGVL